MREAQLLAVGDIDLHTTRTRHPFGGLKDLLADKDILFGNLETVLSSKGKAVEKAFSLRASPDTVAYLTDAGFDVVNVANNHIMDYGPEGLNETLEVLEENRILFLGVSTPRFRPRPVIANKNRLAVGFLGYRNGELEDPPTGIRIAGIDRDNIIRDVTDLRSRCDVVVVSLHWGIENVFYPSVDQISLARQLVDAGAAVILGHHPHVVQGMEEYGKGLIAYSLGNFQFSPHGSPTDQSIVLSVTVSENGVQGYTITPVTIDEDFVPHRTGKQKSQDFLATLASLSRPIEDGTLTEQWWFEQIAKEHLRGNLEAWGIRIRRYGIRHLLQCGRWLVSPFVLKCYLGMLRRGLRQHE